MKHVNISTEEYDQITLFNALNWKLPPKVEIALADAKQHKGVNRKMFENARTFFLSCEYYRFKIWQYYNNSLITLLNRLEWISMIFNTELADDEVVYQSLHQTFLKTVKYLYPRLCVFNTGATSDMYYTNIIELYNRWKDRNMKDMMEEERKNRESRKKIVREESKF